MSRLYSLITYLFFGYIAYLLVIHHGERWEVGHYGLPHVLIAADREHYLDGAIVEPTVREIVDAGLEVEVQLVVYSLIAAWLFVMIRLYRQIVRGRRRLEELHARNALLDRIIELKQQREKVERRTNVGYGSSDPV